ncbi:MAG: hypothetical protein WBR18_08410 [Anaerolineales bacterium]
MSVALLAGSASTVIFAFSTMPMLIKAVRTKDLSSYSLGNILLSNLGNVVHSVYVFSLPAGPIWLLHTFYLVTTALMLVWYLRYEGAEELRTHLTGSLKRSLLGASASSQSTQAAQIWRRPDRQTIAGTRQLASNAILPRRMRP